MSPEDHPLLAVYARVQIIQLFPIAASSVTSSELLYPVPLNLTTSASSNHFLYPRCALSSPSLHLPLLTLTALTRLRPTFCPPSSYISQAPGEASVQFSDSVTTLTSPQVPLTVPDTRTDAV